MTRYLWLIENWKKIKVKIIDREDKDEQRQGKKRKSNQKKMRGNDKKKKESTGNRMWMKPMEMNFSCIVSITDRFWYEYSMVMDWKSAIR